jgi:hypothetical protein
MAKYHVIDDDTDEVVFRHDILQIAEAHAGERNADWPGGIGPFTVITDVDPDNDPHPDPDDAYDPD